MRKRTLLTLLILIMIFLPFNLMAEDKEQIETIEEEETPLAQRRPNYSIYYMGGAAIIFLGAMITNYQKRNNGLKLVIDEIEDNGDGSYIIHLGYDNRTGEDITFSEDNAGLRVISGNAILLKRGSNTEFNMGQHKDEFIAVVNEETVLQYTAGDQKITIKGSDLFNRGHM